MGSGDFLPHHLTMLFSRWIEHYVSLLGLLLLCWVLGDVAGMLEPSASVLHAWFLSAWTDQRKTQTMQMHMEE